MQKNKETIKKKLDEAIAQLKNNSKDAKFAEKLIDNILSYKGQLDIEPTIIHLPTKGMVKEYDMDSIKFYRFNDCIVFKALGGYKVIVDANCAGLFEHLNVLLDMKDIYDNLSDERKEAYDMLYSATFYQFISPLISVGSDKAFFGIATEIIKHLNELTDEALNKPLQPETPLENAEFEAKVDLLNQIAEEDA